MYAQTALKIGFDDKVVRYDEGDELDQGDIPDDVWQSLLEADALKDVPPLGNHEALAQAFADKDATIAALQLQLAAHGEVDPDKALDDRDQAIADLQAQLDDANAARAQAEADAAEARAQAAENASAPSADETPAEKKARLAEAKAAEAAQTQ